MNNYQLSFYSSCHYTIHNLFFKDCYENNNR